MQQTTASPTEPAIRQPERLDPANAAWEMERDKRYARRSLLTLVLTVAALLPMVLTKLPALRTPVQPIAVALYLGGLLLTAIEALVWAVYLAQYRASARSATRPSEVSLEEAVAEELSTFVPKPEPPPVFVPEPPPAPLTALVLANMARPEPEDAGEKTPPATRERAFRRQYQRRRFRDQRRARTVFAQFQRRGLVPRKSPLPLAYGEVCHYFTKALWADAAAPASRPLRGRFGVTNWNLCFSSASFIRRLALERITSLEMQEDGGIKIRTDGRRRPDVFYLDYPLEFLVVLLCCYKSVWLKPPFSPELARRILSEMG